MDPTDLYRTLPNSMEYIFLPSAFVTFFRIDHVVSHKLHLNRFEKIDIIQSIFFNYKQEEVRNELLKEKWKIYKFVEINTISKKWWIKEEITREIRKWLKINENNNTTYHTLCNTAKAVITGECQAIKAHIKRQERSQVNNLT